MIFAGVAVLLGIILLATLAILLTRHDIKTYKDGKFLSYGDEDDRPEC